MRQAKKQLIVCLLLSWGIVAQDAGQVLSETGISNGLAVHFGTSDGTLETGLAREGTLLVHGLAADAAKRDGARNALLSEGLYGMASVQVFPEGDMLPYADNLVNLIIADLREEPFSAISANELNRILVPGGVAYTNTGGGWQASAAKQRPSGMGEWRHARHDATNNPVSSDELVGPATTLQWLDGYSDGVHMSTAGIVLSGDNMVAHYTGLSFKDTEGRKIESRRINVRDAFNGLYRWSKEVHGRESKMGYVIIEDGTLISSYERDGYSHVYDLFSGAELTALTNGLNSSENIKRDRDNGIHYDSKKTLVCHDGVLYEAAGNSLAAVDIQTGTLKWMHTAPQAIHIAFPSVSTDGQYVFIAESDTAFKYSRWPTLLLRAITCLNTSDGTVKWRNTEVAGMATSYLIFNEDKVILHGTSGIGTMADNPMTYETNPAKVGVIDLEGNMLWVDDFRPAPGEKPPWVQTAFARDGKVHLANSKFLGIYNLVDGTNPQEWETWVTNQRCERVTATVKYTLMGFGTYLDAQGNYVDQNIARSGCASGAIPANGMTYHANNGCWCFAQVRGFSALSSEPMRTRVADEKRLVSGNGYVASVDNPALIPTVSQVQTEEGLRAPNFTGDVIRQSWYNNSDLPYPRTPQISDGGISVEASVNEHLIEAENGNNEIVWRFMTDGRISIQPVIHGGNVYVGAHDGWVYCLDLNSGELKWRYLAAPAHRWIVVYGQVESAWPVQGLVVHDGQVFFSAGRHPELDYGISLGGLDAETGEQKWRGSTYRPTATTWLKIGERGAGNRHVNLLANPFLKMENNKLIMVTNELVAAGQPKGETKSFEVDSASIKPVSVAGYISGVRKFRTPSIIVNPVGIVVTFPEGALPGTEITIYSGIGRTVEEMTVNSGNEVMIPLAHLARGRYVVGVRHKGHVYTASVISKGIHR